MGSGAGNHRSNVIFTETIAYLVEESIAIVGKGVVGKTRQISRVDLNSSEFDEVSDFTSSQDGEFLLIVSRRSFLDIPRFLLHSASVTQSSTEAHGGGINP